MNIEIAYQSYIDDIACYITVITNVDIYHTYRVIPINQRRSNSEIVRDRLQSKQLPFARGNYVEPLPHTQFSPACYYRAYVNKLDFEELPFASGDYQEVLHTPIPRYTRRDEYDSLFNNFFTYEDICDNNTSWC